MLDTFYVERPVTLPIPGPELVEKIRAVHEHGGDTGSEGWQYAWSEEEARRPVLRPHTTARTIQYLSQHPDPPVKVFHIGRSFRREAENATHLSEFTQIEGIVMEEEASLSMLLGLLTEFYRRLGLEVRARPAFFPYTEPSLEPEVRFKDGWLEMGGAGIFRPEVLSPFGIRAPVLAWGLGLERLVMMGEGLTDVRELYAPDLDWLRRNRTLRLHRGPSGP